MKKRTLFLTAILISITFNAFCQKATYDEVNTKKAKGLVGEYISQSGEVFKVGDTITLGVPFRNEAYDFIKQNAGLSYYPLTALSAGSNVIIKKMKAQGKNLNVYTTKPDGMVYGLIIVNFDEALNANEIENKLLSSDEALEELKKAKDKLDLEIITQEEYDAVKADLIKYIK